MKVRLLAVMAVVVVGVMAGTSPAMASQWSHQHADNKKFGEAIYKLRKANDLTNYSVGQITAAATDALLQLKDGLTKVSDATTNFKYGVVQVAADPGDPIAGVGPSHFFATSPIYKTGEQSSVTFGVPAGLGTVSLYTAVRSLYPDTGSVACKVSASGAANIWQSLKEGTTTGIFINMPQSRLTPQNGNSAYPYSLIPTEDNVLDLADPQYGVNVALPSTVTRVRLTAANTSTVTLSCLRTS